MLDYIVRKPFRTTTQGERVMGVGEALCVSSLKASKAVQLGFLSEKNVNGLGDVVNMCEKRAKILVEKLICTQEEASNKATELAISLLIRHESLKSFRPPSTEFLEEVVEFNNQSTGTNPITKIQSETGAGEWAGYNCNIGSGCSHMCLYCYAVVMALRFQRIESEDAWREEIPREVTTAKCKTYFEPIMFPTTHDITEEYLPAYRCHLYNLLEAGNKVLVVTKPHRSSIEAICSEFSSFRDNMTFRFTIGGLDPKALEIWEPGAPRLSERMWCLRYAFEHGFKTSISSEPMLVSCEDAERFYYTVEPLVTEDIWFGKMNNVGGFRKHKNPEVVSRAEALVEAYKDENILNFVRTMKGLPKVEWKDSIKKIIDKNTTKKPTNNELRKEETI